MSNNCFYCLKNEALDELMIEICELEASTLYLFKEQTYRGRCLVAFKGHKNELFDLTDEERDLFMKDVARAAKAMKLAFDVNKVNYGVYSSSVKRTFGDGIISKVPPHPGPSSYLGTKWKCKWGILSEYAP